MNKEKTSSTLGMLHDLYSIFEAMGPDPQRGSPADHEIRSFSRPESIRTAFSQAKIALEAAADHLEALDTLVRPKEYAIAPWTCARGLLEASSIAIWLLDTRIDARERVSRSLSLRFAALRNQEKMARAADEPTLLRKIQDRIRSVEKIAIELAFKVGRKDRNNLIWIAQPKPNIVDLVTKVIGSALWGYQTVQPKTNLTDPRVAKFEGGNIYRILSAVAHSDYAVLLEVAFAPDYQRQPGGLLTRRAIPIELQGMLVSISAAVYARASWFQTVQFGCDAAQVAVVLEKCFNELNLADTNEVRFWRTVVGGGR